MKLEVIIDDTQIDKAAGNVILAEVKHFLRTDYDMRERIEKEIERAVAAQVKKQILSLGLEKREIQRDITDRLLGELSSMAYTVMMKALEPFVEEINKINIKKLLEDE